MHGQNLDLSQLAHFALAIFSRFPENPPKGLSIALKMAKITDALPLPHAHPDGLDYITGTRPNSLPADDFPALFFKYQFNKK